MRGTAGCLARGRLAAPASAGGDEYSACPPDPSSSQPCPVASQIPSFRSAPRSAAGVPAPRPDEHRKFFLPVPFNQLYSRAMQFHPLIETNPALVEFCDFIGNTDFITVDTAFIRATTFSPQICKLPLHHLDPSP